MIKLKGPISTSNIITFAWAILRSLCSVDVIERGGVSYDLQRYKIHFYNPTIATIGLLHCDTIECNKITICEISIDRRGIIYYIDGIMGQ